MNIESKKTTNRIRHSLEAVIDDDCEVLILGTLPSIKSRENNFYYMHPKNRFWIVLSKIYNVDFVNASKNEKIDLLLKNKIALFDIVQECDIVNSSDSKISNVVYHDIDQLIKNTRINKIALNGKKALELFLKSPNKACEQIIGLPSTSPANAQYSIDMLIEAWSKGLENN